MKASDKKLEAALLNSGFKVTAVSCILICENELLLIKRKKDPHQGLYCPVGGKVDPHESPKTAIVREVKEETGFDIDPPVLGGVMVESSPVKYNWISLIFSYNIDRVEPPISDEGELEWIHKDRLESIPIPKTDLYIYKKILAKEFFFLDVDYDKDLNINEMADNLDKLKNH